MNIGGAIKRARKAHGFSQAELALVARVGRSALVLLEGGKGTVRTLSAVAPHLNFRPTGIGAGSTLAKQIKTARRNREMSQAEVAVRAGVSIPTVRALERGGGSIVALSSVLSVLAPRARENAIYRAHYQIREDVRLTPPEFMAEVVHYFGDISIDVAGAPNSFVDAERVIYEDEDGLVTTWSGHTAWCNPPYSQLSRWMNRCADAWDRNEVSRIIGLFPARTETLAFRTRIVGKADVLLLPRRLRFHDKNRVRLDPSPFALMLCTWGFDREFVEAYVTATGSTPLWSDR